jgi:hypothetical protein
MTVLSIWRASPDLLIDKSVKQVIAISGRGKLLDDGDTSQEFRALLSEIPAPVLARFSNDCLEEAFTDSGLALQDLINEVGRRLGFKVQNGRYRGRQGVLGYDGLWELPNKHHLVVEVKTTDAYRIDLNTISAYRRELVRQGGVSEENSSMLIVVGRADTGDLEAQIRGSRSAWEMRLISIDALLRLMILRQSIEDPDALRRAYQILIPREFTKLDEIVDLVFSTAEDAISAAASPNDADAEKSAEAPLPQLGPKFIPVAFNDSVARRVADSIGVPLLKRTRALFSSPDNETRVVCVASREYDESSSKGYWFAFHPHQKETLQEVPVGYAAFGCGSAERIVLIPIADLSLLLEGLNQTIKPGRTYWHVTLATTEGRLMLLRKKGLSRIDLSKYVLDGAASNAPATRTEPTRGASASPARRT